MKDSSGGLTEKTSSNSFRKLFRDFASDTSFGGISKVASSDGIFRRLVWAVLSTVCYFFTIYLSFAMVEKFMKKPITTSIGVSHIKNVEFPAVTFCNLNKFRKSKISQLETVYQVLEDYRAHEDNETSASDTFTHEMNVQKNNLQKEAVFNSGVQDDKGDDDDDDDDDVAEQEILRQLVAIKASFIDEKTLESVGHRKEDMLVSCSWMGVDCKSGYFSKFWANFWHWDYGNCYTFNPGMDTEGKELKKLRTNLPGPDFGLTLDVNIQQADYIDQLSDEAGLKLVIHNSQQMAFPSTEGITIPVGFSSSVAIRKEIIDRVDPFQEGSCSPRATMAADNIYKEDFQKPFYKYSVKACMWSCWAYEQIRMCNCTGVSFSHIEKKVCETRNESACLYGVKMDYMDDKIGCVSKCPEPCHHESFIYSYMMSALTTQKQEEEETKIEITNGEPEKKDASNSYLRLRVYYEQLNLQKIVESNDYTMTGLMGDIGGQLGLWVGVSVISVAEFGELLISLVLVAFRKYRARNDVIHVKAAAGLEMK